MKYENYAHLRDLKNMKDFHVSKATGIATSTFTDWKKGRSVPKADKMQKIANALGVSYAYLMGYEDSVTDVIPSNNLVLSQSEINLVKQWRNADDESKNMIMRILAFSKQGGDINID